MDKPLVSTCIIAYNHEAYIEECLLGALKQKLEYPYEIVIGEDKSTDKTLKICREYASKFPDKIRLLERTENLGMNGNWVDTIKNCNGKYIALCEGDDYWTDPLKLQKQADLLENDEEFVLSYHNAMCINEDNSNSLGLKLNKSECKDFEGEKLKRIVTLPTSGVLFRKFNIDLIPDGFYKVLNADTFLWAILGEFGGAKYLDTVEPSRYRIHDLGIYSSLNKFERNAKRLDTFKYIQAYYKKDKDIYSFYKEKIRTRKFYMLKSSIKQLNIKKQFIQLR